MARILVTDGEQRAALAAVRSLGRSGHDVFVCAAERYSIAGGSRYATAEKASPSPLVRPGAFARWVSEFVRAERIDVVLPISEAALTSLLPVRRTIGGAVIPFPDEDTVRRICDKAAVLDVAARIGIAVPRETRLDRPPIAGLDGIGDIGFPLVIKPTRSVVGTGAGALKFTAVHARDEAALALALAAFPRESYPLLIQQRVVGPGIGVFILLVDGEVVAAFGHRRIREKPPAGGVSVYRASVTVPPDLLHQSVALLRELEWEGVAMVEYKQDVHTGRHYLMEVNGRLWGSLQLAIDAGVDFPALLVAAALGESVVPVRNYGAVRTRWLMGDIDHLLARLRHDAVELDLPPDAAGRARCVIDFLAAFKPGIRNEVFRWSDPVPAFREIIGWLSDFAVRSGRRSALPVEVSA